MKQPLSILRIKREMQAIHISSKDQVSLECFPDGTAKVLYTLEVTEGVYRNQKYSFVINVPSNYPFAPPKPVCLSNVLHPSIDHIGRVCMNITREDWSIQLGIQTVLFGLSSIFYDLPTEEPLNKEAHALLTKDPKQFEEEVLKVYSSNK